MTEKRRTLFGRLLAFIHRARSHHCPCHPITRTRSACSALYFDRASGRAGIVGGAWFSGRGGTGGPCAVFSFCFSASLAFDEAVSILTKSSFLSSSLSTAKNA